MNIYIYDYQIEEKNIQVKFIVPDGTIRVLSEDGEKFYEKKILKLLFDSIGKRIKKENPELLNLWNRKRKEFIAQSVEVLILE